MQTYEVKIPLLDSGRNMNILMAASSADEAKAYVRTMLHEIGVKSGREYDIDDVSVVACHVEPA
jgi:hypothetical protein